MPVLTGIDILGIQGYIFTSNRLRDVFAASGMVESAASHQSLANWGLTRERVLAAGGGNAIVEFDRIEDARAWTARYTRWLQEKAPGLEVAVAHRPYEKGQLAWALWALQVKLARTKLERQPSAPQLGLSVTAACAVTGLPATAVDQGDLVSPQIKGLRERLEDAKALWDKFLPACLEKAPSWNAEFPLELDLMGRTRGTTSLIGVIHVDGNGVGLAIQEWLKRSVQHKSVQHKTDDEEVRRQYAEWSPAIRKLGNYVLHSLVKRVSECIHEGNDGERPGPYCVLRGTPHELGFRLNDWREAPARAAAQHTVFLPLRPIVLGGDDVTFVCDGRIALDLAATAMREFEGHAIPHLGKDGDAITLTACAGVSLVKVHAPFHRGYALAEDLCHSAKRARRDANEKSNSETGGWLDWHEGSTRPREMVEDICHRQYRGGGNWLTMRPYPLAPIADRDQAWEWLDKELLGPGGTWDTAEVGFRGMDTWQRSRRRVKVLDSLARSGPDEVRRQIEAWRVTDPDTRLPGGLGDVGFVGDWTPLLDAVEFMDLHIRLEPDPREGRDTASTTGSDSSSLQEAPK